ncbi:MAG TPA: type IV secretion system DNA-binding domain-containing protein [Pyrinomonadaceae bacterium]|nr:type IV secretion system DNA-binding domain-containing protein [Pyrinomonadaceae bacterium]
MIKAIRKLGPPKPAIEIKQIPGVPIPEWAITPEKIETFPKHTQKAIQRKQEHFAKLIATETQQLQALGLPIPAQISPLSFNIKAKPQPRIEERLKNLEYAGDPADKFYECVLKWEYPTFSIPPNFVLTFDSIPRSIYRYPEGCEAKYYNGGFELNKYIRRYAAGRDAAFKDYEVPHTTYCISGDQQLLEQAEATFKASGAGAVITQFRGAWSNRDPYALFAAINLSPLIKEDESYWNIALLWPIACYTPAQISEREWQLYLFNNVMQGIESLQNIGKGSDLYLTQWPDERSYEYLHTAPPLPAPQLPAKPATLKIIPTADTRPALSEELIDNLRAAKEPVTFALESSQDEQFFTITCGASDRPLIEHLLQSYVPDCAALEHEPALATGSTPYTITAVLKNQYGSIKPLSQFALDPYRQLFTLFDSDPTAHIQFKVMIQATPQEFADHFTKRLKERRQYADGERKSETSERLKQWQKKQPMWSVIVCFESPDPVALDTIAATFLRQYETSDAAWQFYSESQSPPIPFSLLSTTEITALVHFPTKDVTSDRLETVSSKTKLPPALYTETKPTAVSIGTATHRGKTVTVTLPEQVRDRHVYIVGKSGMGKSTLITNMAVRDIQAGRGVAIVDPHGDLIDDILPYIPPERVEDTILFNPSDKSHPVTLSPLAAASEDEYEQVVSDLVATMTRLSETWGIQIDYLFRAIFNTLVRVPGATFIDVHDIIASEKRREQILRQVSHPRVLNFWYEQFEDLLPKSARLPILTRMERIVDSPTLSRILSSAESRLNFTDVIENKKIFLARLSKGEIGEDNCKLLGSILTSQLQLAIMRRARIAKAQRTPFYLYVDEFQNFTTPTFETILSEARKYQLSLTFAHQFVTQLSDQMRSAILGNVSTVMMFNLDVSDGRKLEGQLGAYTHDDVAQLPKYQLLCRPATSSQDTFAMATLPPLPRPQVDCTRAIIEHTRATYSASAQTQSGAGKPEPEIVITPPIAPTIAATPERTPQPGATVRLMKAEQLDGLPTKEKILLYVGQAEYLATPHIISLCFGHYANENSRKANASSTLKELVEAGQLRMQPFGKSKIYFTGGRAPNPTTHNVAVRDLFVKFICCGFAIAEMNFGYEHIPGLVPDLYVGFSAEGGGVVTTFWEYDTGTEGMAVIEQKLRRYRATGFDRLVFVVPGEARRQQLLRTISEPGVYVVQLDELTGLTESVFWVAGQSEPRPLFEP